MNLSLSIFGQTLSFGSAKSVSPELSAWLRGDDTDGDEGAKLTRPYAQSAWVYIAVNRLAEKLASIPFRISVSDEASERRLRRRATRRDMGEEIMESGPVVDLFNCPHVHLNRQLFWESVVTWLMLRGEAFIVPVDAQDQPVDLAASNAQVAGMLTLAPEMFWHIVQGYELGGWRYTGSPLVSPLPSEILLPTEVIHARTPNPYLFWRGMSPLAVAATAAGADYAAAKYSQGYWLNNADTGVIVTTDQQATPEQRNAILSALRERKRKAGTADRPLFLWGGAKVEKPQLSGMEAQFIENRKMNRQEIAAIFGVPDSIMGFSDAKASGLSGGGSAISAEMLLFVENTIGPLCCRLESAVAPIVKTFGPNLVGWFDLESLPVMQEARRQRLDTAVKAFQIGVPLNDCNRVYDLGFPEYGWGNKSFLPFSIQEVGTDEPLPGEDDPADPAAEPTDPETDTEENPIAAMASFLGKIRNPKSGIRNPATAVLWQSHMATRKKLVGTVKARTSRVLMEYRIKTLAKLESVYGDKASPTQQRSLIDLIFNPHEFGKRLVVELTNPITLTLQAAGNELHKELGLDDAWTMPPQKAKDWLDQRTQPIMDAGQTVRAQINTTLQAGLDAGETTKELAARVKAAFTSLSDYEAKRVAQTEVNAAYNDARHDAMGSAGIEYKAWLSSHGPRVRPSHAQAELDYIDNPIPIDEPFRVGPDQMMYPGDGSLGAGPENLINCQCVQLAAEKVGEDEKSITFNIHGLGERSFPLTHHESRITPHVCH